MVRGYRVYRSITGNTGKADFLATSSQNKYSDGAVVNKVGYFYRVSAVTKSGTEGDASEEIFLKYENQNVSNVIMSQEVISSIDSLISKIESYVNKNKIMKESLEEDEIKNDLAISLGLYDSIDSVNNELDLLIGEAKILKLSQEKDEVIRSKINQINLNFENIKNSMIKDVLIVPQGESEQQVSVEDYEKLAKEYASANLLTDDQLEFYLSAANILQAGSRISKRFIEFNIIKESGDSEKGGFVSEKILAIPEGFNSILIQEVLPRGSVKFSDLEFNPSASDINGNGPLWRLSDLKDKKLFYRYLGELNESITSAKTVVFPSVEEVLVKYESPVSENGGITGNVVGDVSSTSKEAYVYLGLVLVIIMLVAVYLLMSQPSLMNNSKMGYNSIRKDSGNLVTGSLRLQEMSGLLAKSRDALSRGDLGVAREAYESARKLYFEELKLNEKLAINAQMNKLYEDILSRLL